MDNKKTTIKNKEQFAPYSVKDIKLLDFGYDSSDRQLAQEILRLKMYLVSELEEISDEYKYKSGFPESAVNQMLYFAYLYGKYRTREEAQIVAEAEMVKKLRNMLKDTMDMLNMMPAEEINDYY